MREHYQVGTYVLIDDPEKPNITYGRVHFAHLEVTGLPMCYTIRYRRKDNGLADTLVLPCHIRGECNPAGGLLDDSVYEMDVRVRKMMKI